MIVSIRTGIKKIYEQGNDNRDSNINVMKMTY